MHRARRSPAGPVALVVAGVLAAGPLGGCGGQPKPAPAEPPTMTTPTMAPPLPLPQPQPPSGPTPPEPGLGTEDQAKLTKARRVGAQWVILRVATEPTRSAEISAELEKLGGVLGTSPDVDSLRLTMPTDQVERAAALPGISALDVEQVVPPNNPRPTGPHPTGPHPTG